MNLTTAPVTWQPGRDGAIDSTCGRYSIIPTGDLFYDLVSPPPPAAGTATIATSNDVAELMVLATALACGATAAPPGGLALLDLGTGETTAPGLATGDFVDEAEAIERGTGTAGVDAEGKRYGPDPFPRGRPPTAAAVADLEARTCTVGKLRALLATMPDNALVMDTHIEGYESRWVAYAMVQLLPTEAGSREVLCIMGEQAASQIDLARTKGDRSTAPPGD